MALLCAPGLAWPDALELLAPRELVAPEGFLVAVRRADPRGNSIALQAAPALEFKGAVAERLPGGEPWALFRVRPLATVRSVHLGAKDGALRVDRDFSVGPEAAQVSLSVLGQGLVKGRDVETQLAVEVLGPDGKPDATTAPPVLRANVGTLGAVERVGPGRFRARYRLPETRYPEVAVVVAFAAWPHAQSAQGALGALRIPLASAIELPGTTEPDADFSITIAGRRFGPVKAGGDGRFLVPVEVPPGYGTGQGLAIDRLGNRSAVTVDLALPPTKQLACVATPTRLPADGTSRARVLCATSDPFGNAAPGAKVALSAAHGVVDGPRVLPGGVLEFGYRAPEGLAEERLAATWKQGAREVKEEVSLALIQGPAASLRLELGNAVVHQGGALAVQVEVTDALGRPRSGAVLQTGDPQLHFEQQREEQPGRLRALLVPDAAVGRGPRVLEVSALGPFGSEPARIAAWGSAGHLWVKVEDLAGLPVPSQPLEVDGRAVKTGASGELDLGALRDGAVQLRHGEWPDLVATLEIRDQGTRVFAPASPSLSARSRAELAVAGPTPLVVRLESQGARVRAWCESPRGERLEACALDVRASGGRLEPGSSGEWVLSGGTGPVSISAVERSTGVTALVEVTP
ncbi:MAG: hypothetical protein K1X89_19915 [Myxococcaceae bacterium]|nr:hypothetical protein [Myxococcaceae bacterium]